MVHQVYFSFSRSINCFFKTYILLFSYSFLVAQPYDSGQSYFGENDYIEYKAGNLPIIISAPHGGTLEPAEIPNRSCSGCVTVRDSNTEELSRQMYDAIFELFGCYPHVVINRLHRRKLDANRAIGDAADGNVLAEQAWRDFHGFIEGAKASITNQFGKGLYLDLHGHGHDIQRLELGYLLSKSNLQLSNTTLSQDTYLEKSSIKQLIYNNLQNLELPELLRGADSFGELYEQLQFPAVPSETDPFPLDEDKYFSGGYNTERHGSKLDSSIDGIQIECNMEGVRDNHSNRENFAEATALVLKEYLEKHYFGVDFLNANCNLVTSIKDENLQWNSAIPAIHIFPNPVGPILQVQIRENNSTDFTLTIFNQLGQIVFKQSNIGGKSTEIGVENLPSGRYVLEVQSAHFVGFKKLIKIGYLMH